MHIEKNAYLCSSELTEIALSMLKSALKHNKVLTKMIVMSNNYEGTEVH